MRYGVPALPAEQGLIPDGESAGVLRQVPAGLQVLHVLLPGFRVLPEKVLLPAF
jgi:hypothetical protein